MRAKIIVRRFFLFFFLIAMALSAGILFYYLVAVPRQNRQMTEELKETFSPKPPFGENGPEGDSPTEEPAGKEELSAAVDLSALQEEYPDVKGWLTIPGTVIDYPVLQGNKDEPEYYLRRNYKGKYDINGSLFFQWNCAVPEGENLVIYGHNMNSGVMFGTLDSYADRAYCEAHPDILLQMKNGVWKYHVCAVLKADVSMFDFQQTVFQEPDGLQEYLSKAAERKVSGNKADEKNPAQLLTLVTCSYEWDGARTIVIAVRENKKVM